MVLKRLYLTYTSHPSENAVSKSIVSNGLWRQKPSTCTAAVWADVSKEAWLTLTFFNSKLYQTGPVKYIYPHIPAIPKEYNTNDR